MKSKLVEKGTRMPDINQPTRDNYIQDYFHQERDISESARSHRFFRLLDQLFGIQPGFIEEYVEGIERYVKGEAEGPNFARQGG